VKVIIKFDVVGSDKVIVKDVAAQVLAITADTSNSVKLPQSDISKE
jgi:hypothetical protein